MKLGWLTLTGVSALACACSGTTVIGNGIGATGGSGGGGGGDSGSTAAGASFSGGAGATSGTGGTGGVGGTAVGGAGAIGGSGVGGSGGPIQELGPVGPQVSSNKLDVLFVIDNSVGMGPKQALLAASVPSFVQRLANPLCVDTQGNAVATQPTSGAAACSSGTREFAPVTDMHLGAITTSLGAHGGIVCSAPAAGDDPANTHLDDQAELLPTKRTGVASYMNSGFLSFDQAGKTGVTDVAALTAQLQTMITAAGAHGCGFEAPLEAMYRFLIDPAPPSSVQKVNNTSTPTGINQELLAQRAAFLRPDSSVAIVVLSDENDCSIMDSGIGWFVGATSHMPAATAACATNPNDPCCRSCAQNEVSPPAGCTALSADPVCSQGVGAGTYQTLDNLHDSLNLRCFDQKARFGFDLLNPLQRYSVGLTNSQVVDWNGTLVDNPLFAARDGKPARSPSLISVSFIVGAPWEDVSTDASRKGSNLTFLDAASLETLHRWPLLVGDPANNVNPTDPFMIESIDPRSGQSPLTGEPIVDDTSTNPSANTVNGHEQNLPARDDLQYACIFKAGSPLPCTPGDSACACSATKNGDASAVTTANSPLCQPPAGGPATTTQYYDKGNPGTRELLVARALGSRAVPASVCAWGGGTVTGPSDGYVPALGALAHRLGQTLQ